MTDLVETGSLDVAAPPKDIYGARRAWYALIVFEFQGLAAGIDLAIVTLLVRPIEAAFRINDVGFAAITAMPVAIGFVVAYYPAGLLTDTFRRRDIVAAGGVLWGIAAIIAARADSGAMLFFARLLAGIGTAMPSPAIFSMLTDAFPRTRRALAYGAYWSGSSIGVGVGLTICGALVEATQRNGIVHAGGMLFAPWQQCFIACAAMGIIVLALVFTIPEPPRGEIATSTNSDLASSLRVFGQYLRRNWMLWTLMLFGGAIGLTSYYIISAWAPTFGMRHYGAVGVSSIALLGTFIAGGSLLGSIGGGFLAQWTIDHGDSRLLPRILIGVAAVCVAAAVFPYMPSWLLAVAGMGAVDAALNAMCILIAIGIQETASNEVRGQLYGVWGFLAYVPSIAAATLVAFLASGVLAKAGGLGPSLAVVAAVTSVIAVLLFALSSGPYQRAREELRAVIVPSRTEM